MRVVPTSSPRRRFVDAWLLANWTELKMVGLMAAATLVLSWAMGFDFVRG